MKLYSVEENKDKILNWKKTNKETENRLCRGKEEDYWIPKLMRYWGMTEKEAYEHCRKIRLQCIELGGK